MHAARFAWLGRAEHRLVDEIHHLEDVERERESGATPFLALIGVVLFLLPIFLLMCGLAFLAYYVL